MLEEESWKYKIFLTGRPGIGKTTVVKKVLELLNAKAGGIFCPEVRKEGKRVGFKIVDIGRGQEGILAWIGISGPRVGKYGVNVEEAEKIGVGAIEYALKECDIIVVDELGPMELAVPALKKAIFKAINSSKPGIIVVHRRLAARYPCLEVTLENRNRLPVEIAEKLRSWLSK